MNTLLVARQLSRHPLRASGVTLALVAVAAAPPVEAATTRLLLKRVQINALAPLSAPGAATVTFRGRLALPAGWAVRSNTATGIVLQDADYPSCQFTIRIYGRATRSTDQSTQARVTTLTKAPKRWVLDSGTRGTGAWNVYRVPGPSSQGVKLEGVLVQPLKLALVQAPGLNTWAELHVSAKAPAGSECHSGMTREALAPQIGDALSTYRSNIFIKPA
jgi:hypothetical protein